MRSTLLSSGKNIISQRGFTLIEMAIVLAIMGLLVGGGLIALGPIVDRTHLNQTNANLDQIESALVLFAIQNTRLPCPANGHDTPGAATYGLEQPAGGAGTCAFTSGCSAGNAVSCAVIPWRTLGLDETYSVDGWGNRISYFVANTSNGANTATTAAPNLHRVGATYPGGRTFLRINDTSGNEITTTTAGTAPQDGAVYVLISHGKSGWYGWNKAGNQMPAVGAGSLNKAANNVGPPFVQGSPNSTTTNTFFDDIVRWRSPAMIIQLCGSGACGNP